MNENKTKVSFKIGLILFVFLLIFMIVFSLPNFFNNKKANVDENQPDYLKSLNKSYVNIGNIQVKVYLAKNDLERGRGLSYTKALLEDEGMLFVFDKSDIYQFWMKGMNYPLDIIWINDQKRIIHIEHSLSPETFPNLFSSESPALYVLEVNAGFCEKHQIKIGDIVSF